MATVQSDRPQTALRCAAGVNVGATMSFSDWFGSLQAEVDAALAAHFRAIEATIGPHSRLPAAVQYSLKIGGKRLRPLLVLECSRICGGQTEAAMPAAIALELVHTFSLIHDDLPAMDDDDTRRGHPTNHKVFGEGMAVLAGDWLLAHAFRVLTAECKDEHLAASLARTLAAGTEAMIAGQAADLDGEEHPADRKLVEFIHLHKTAALIETACRLGALSARADDHTIDALARYGHHLGLAFQITDDLLDATGSAERLGKRVRKDATASKQTYPAVYGLQASRQAAAEQVEAGLRCLEPLGARAVRLRELAQFVLRRDQ